MYWKLELPSYVEFDPVPIYISSSDFPLTQFVFEHTSHSFPKNKWSQNYDPMNWQLFNQILHKNLWTSAYIFNLACCNYFNYFSWVGGGDRGYNGGVRFYNRFRVFRALWSLNRDLWSQEQITLPRPFLSSSSMKFNIFDFIMEFGFCNKFFWKKK